MFDPPATWFAILEAQSGAASRQQALAAGYTSHGIVAQVRARRWQSIVPGVLATFTGPLGPKHQVWVGLLAVGDQRAALSHDSAAYLHGLIDEAPSQVHVTLPSDAGARSRGPVLVHRTRRSLRVAGVPPVVSVEDTLCDVAASWPPDQLAAALASILGRGTTTPQHLARRIDERGRFRGATALRAVLADVAVGAQSALEVRYLRDVERGHGLPKGERQSRARRGGRTTYRDVYYRPYRVAVELNGRAFHEGVAAEQRDAVRLGAAHADGEVTLVYEWESVAMAPCAVAAEVATVLKEAGWRGVVRPCRSCGGSLRLGT